MSNFIEDDEYIILFDGRDRPIAPEGFALIASSGVRTALRNLEWIFVETTPGHYDWSEYDEFVENCVRNGMKALLVTPDFVPACMPDDWYCRSDDGKIQRDFPQLDYTQYSAFSPWHSEAQAYQDDFTKMVIERYSSYPVQAIRGGAHGGESLLPYDSCYFEPAAVESFRVWANNKLYGRLDVLNQEEGTAFQDWSQVKPSVFEFARVGHRPITRMWLKEHLTNMVVRQQSLLVRHYGGEAWMMLAHCWMGVVGTGNFLIPEIAEIVMERVQPTQINWIAFAHFNLNSTLMYMALQRVKDEGVKLWTGSQYAEGLPVNTNLAIVAGVRGFVCGPLSLEDMHDQRQIEPWMVQNIKNSIAEWKASRL